MHESGESQSSENFNLDWESLTFSPRSTGDDGWLTSDDWEGRYGQDTTGYIPDPLTRSFTDLDLSGARVDLRNTPGWADIDSWSDA
jgi:hypothetical protein